MGICAFEDFLVAVFKSCECSVWEECVSVCSLSLIFK